MPVVLPADGPRGRRPRRAVRRSRPRSPWRCCGATVTAAAGGRPPASVADEPSSLSVRTAGDLRVGEGAARRGPAVLAESVGTLVTVATTRSNAGGRFSAEVPTTLFVGGAAEQVRPLVRRRCSRRSATRPPSPSGPGQGHLPVAADPRQGGAPLGPAPDHRLRVNLRQAPPGTSARSGALRRVTAQSGLQFRYAGATGVVPGTRKGSTRRAPTWCSPGSVRGSPATSPGAPGRPASAGPTGA